MQQDDPNPIRITSRDTAQATESAHASYGAHASDTAQAHDGARATDDRFQRFSLIGWWNQQKLASARVLVVGAGALGNEIVKNLAMLGVGNVVVVDMDRIENSNLSRSVLFRASDNGRYKAEVAVEAAKQIFPGIRARAVVGSIIDDVGLGLFDWADVVMGGLDNREARLFINRACYRLGKPWIDGAIETIQGTARVFVPEGHPSCTVEGGPCYECTMSENDWRLLQLRRSCNLLTRAEMETGRTPTTPTISSIIAGVQCQEAVKLLHSMQVMSGKGWVFEGLSTDSYQVEFQRKPDCLSHEPLDEVVRLDHSAAGMTVAQLLDEARQRLGASFEIELPREVVKEFVCPRCKKVESVFLPLGKVRAGTATCPDCAGDVQRTVETFFKLRADCTFTDRTLLDTGIRPFDIVFARSGTRTIGLELSGDAASVLAECLAPLSGGLDFV